MIHDNDIDIIDGIYTEITHKSKGAIEMYTDAFVICNGKKYRRSFIMFFDNHPDVITYQNLINISSLQDLRHPYYNFGETNSQLISQPIKMPKWTIDQKMLYGFPIKQRKFDKIRRNYMDIYNKRNLLIQHQHTYCYNIELKYFLLKEYVQQNFTNVDKYLIYDMFDILHYIGLLIAYHNEVASYSKDLGILSQNAITMLQNEKYNFTRCDSDDNSESSEDLRGYGSHYYSYDVNVNSSGSDMDMTPFYSDEEL